MTKISSLYEAIHITLVLYSEYSINIFELNKGNVLLDQFELLQLHAK